MADEDNSDQLGASPGGGSGGGPEGEGDGAAKESGAPEGKGKSGEEEEEEDPRHKAGYGTESKHETHFAQHEYEHEKGGGLKDWKETEVEKEKEGPERKVTIYQYTMGKKPIEGQYEKLVDLKTDKKNKYNDAKLEVDIGHYKASAVSEISYDVDKKELNLTAIDAKVDASVWHAEGKEKFKLGKWIKSLFSSDPPPAPAIPGIPGMPGIPALMAARVGDLTTHGSPLSPGIGSTNVIIGNMPAWRTTLDFHACPIVKGVVPDVGGMVLMGSPTVFINNMMACRIMDFVVEIPGGPNPIAMGCQTVFIGSAAGGGAPAGGGGGAAGGEKAGSPEKKDENELTVQASGEGDVDSVSGELNASFVATTKKISGGVKVSAMAAVLKGSAEAGITIPIPWTSHSITVGGGAEGYAGAIGFEGHAGGSWTKEQGLKWSAGVGGAFGLGGGLNLSLGFK